MVKSFHAYAEEMLCSNLSTESGLCNDFNDEGLIKFSWVETVKCQVNSAGTDITPTLKVAATESKFQPHILRDVLVHYAFINNSIGHIEIEHVGNNNFINIVDSIAGDKVSVANALADNDRFKSGIDLKNKTKTTSASCKAF